MNFFTVPTATFRTLYVLLVVRHGRRAILRLAVTSSPTARWVAQQPREAFPFESAPRFLVFDRDAKFSPEVVSLLRSMRVAPIRTDYRCPWQNGVAERFVGTIRRELLDHVIALSERHLQQLLAQFLDYYHLDRTHLGLKKDAPVGRPIEPRPSSPAIVIGLPRVGGLHRLRLAPSGVAPCTNRPFNSPRRSTSRLPVRPSA